MTICTRGLGSKNLIPTSGLGFYDGEYTPPEITGGTGNGKQPFQDASRLIKEDVMKRLFDSKEKLITPNQVIKAIPADRMAIKVKLVKHELGVKAPEARALIKERITKQIAAMKLYRIEQLNAEAINLILLSVADDD